MITRIKSLSDQLAMPEVYAALQSRLKLGDGEKVRVGCHPAIPLEKWGLTDCEIVPLDKEVGEREEEAMWVDYLQGTDLCVYGINALRAYTKTDLQAMKAFADMEVPVVVVVVNYEKLANREECREVCEYVKWRLREFPGCRLVENPDFAGVEVCREGVLRLCSEVMTAASFTRANERYKKYFVLHALSTLLKRCEEGIAQNTYQQGRIEESVQRKYAKLENRYIGWSKLELELEQRRSQLEKRLRADLEKRKDDILYDIRHDIETTSDIKLYWDKHLPYKLEKSVRFELEKLASVIQADVTTTLRYIENEILRLFKNQQVNPLKISLDLETCKSVAVGELDVVDHKKFQIVMKLGTVGTVLTAGILMAGNPFVGAMMAVSALAGLTSNHLLSKKIDVARQEALVHLPVVADQFISALTTDVVEQLRVAYEQILENLKMEQEKWSEQSKREIEEERRNAEHNLIQSKWGVCREEVMKLMEQLKA